MINLLLILNDLFHLGIIISNKTLHNSGNSSMRFLSLPHDHRVFCGLFIETGADAFGNKS
jgi:hypothetical protein